MDFIFENPLLTAIIAVIFIGAAAAFVGSGIVLRRQSNSGDALSHTALAAIVIAGAFRHDPIFISLVGILVAALVMEIIRRMYPRYAELSTAIIIAFTTGLSAIFAGIWANQPPTPQMETGSAYHVLEHNHNHNHEGEANHNHNHNHEAEANHNHNHNHDADVNHNHNHDTDVNHNHNHNADVNHNHNHNHDADVNHNHNHDADVNHNHNHNHEGEANHNHNHDADVNHNHDHNHDADVNHNHNHNHDHEGEEAHRNHNHNHNHEGHEHSHAIGHDGHAHELEHILFGDIMNISKSQLHLAVYVSLAIIILSIIMYKELLATSFDPESARLAGVNVNAVHIIFTIMIALTVWVASRAVGTLLTSSLLVIPYAASMQLSLSYKKTLITTLLLSTVGSVVAIIIGNALNISPSGTVVVLQTIILVILSIIKKTRN